MSAGTSPPPESALPALVAVAHGSRDPRSTQVIHSLGEEVRRARPELSVATCFLDHEQPRLGDVVSALNGPAVVVPLLLTAAFHSGVDIPAQLPASPYPVVQSAVLGPHPLLLHALERRLEEVGVEPGDPEVAVVLGAAGSSSRRAIATVTALAKQWQERGWWAVKAGFASAAPPPAAEAVAQLRARGAPRVAVATYLLAPGLFADELADAGADVVSAPLGAAPEVAAVVLERYETAAGPTRR